MQRTRRRPADQEASPVDPHAVDRAYHYYRAQRYARIEHRREARLAHFRFWGFVFLLLLGVLVLAVTIWDEIQNLFGL